MRRFLWQQRKRQMAESFFTFLSGERKVRIVIENKKPAVLNVISARALACRQMLLAIDFLNPGLEFFGIAREEVFRLICVGDLGADHSFFCRALIDQGYNGMFCYLAAQTERQISFLVNFLKQAFHFLCTLVLCWGKMHFMSPDV